MAVQGEIRVEKRGMQVKKITEKCGRMNIKEYFNQNMFKSWKEAKVVAGYDKASDSDFATHLLSLEFRRR